MLQTDAALPAGRQPEYPSPAAEAEADGSTVVYFSPTQPDGRRGRATGSRPTPSKGWFVILRLYSPLQPFFDKTWRPGEFEPLA